MLSLPIWGEEGEIEVGLRLTSQLATPCSPASTIAGGATPNANLVLAASILASSLAFIDGSVVNVALTTIRRALGGGSSDMQWAVNAYLLPLSALLLLGGALGDLYGRRPVFLSGIALFAAASIVCALAPGLTILLTGRALQGIGAAMLMPNSLAILGNAFTGESRGRAIGTWAAAGAAAGAVGPLLGGWLVDNVGWRAIFLINLPLAAGALWLGWRYVTDSGDAARPAPDVPGALLATSGLGALTWGLTIAAGPRAASPEALAAVGAGVVLLAAFAWAEARRGDQAMLPLALFGSRAFVGLTLCTVMLYGALGGLTVLLPYVLIGGGYSASGAGAALLPFPLVIALLSRRMGRLAAQIGSRLPLTIGPLIVASGMLLLRRVEAPAHYWTQVLPAVLAVAAGLATSAAPLTTAVLASVDARHTGIASGFNSAAARGGGLIVTALLGSVLAARGAALVTAFHGAALVGAALALAAAVSAATLLGQVAKADQAKAAA